MKNELFDKLATLFNKYGYRLYLIGGTSRDLLLDLPIKDYDVCTDATPDQMREFILDAHYDFACYGNVHFKVDGEHVDITTLREETGYDDFRHPKKVKFVKDIALDALRRDFTINAIYIDENYQIHDFVGGLKDLKNGIIRFIGDPETRIKQDPLRILRAERFKKRFNFEYEEKTGEALEKNKHLIEKLSSGKIHEELLKMKK